MKKMADYIYRRGSRWHYRRRIPKVLQDQYPGEVHWQESLHTVSKPEAIMKARVIAAKHDALIRTAEGQLEWDIHAPGYIGKLAREKAAGRGVVIIPGLEEAARINPDARISLVYQRYKEHKQLVPSSARAFDLAISRFIELCRDRDINKLSRNDIELYRNTIMRLPVRPPHNVRSEPVLKQVEWLEQNPGAKATLSPQTVNAHLSAVRATLKFAFRHTNLIADRNLWIDPTEGFALEVDDKTDESRRAFEDDEVEVVFGPNYEKYAKTDTRYWLPILLYYTGARLSEIGQTRLEELAQTDGDWSITMRNLSDNPRQAKNASSSRTIPLHNRIVELGLDRYVAELHQRGDEWLFPDLDHTRTEGLCKSVSQAFQRYFRSLGGSLATTELTTHGLRHTFRELAFGVPNQKFVEVFQGHVVGDESLSRYGKRISHKHNILRSQVLDQMVFPEINPGTWVPRLIEKELE